MPCIDEECRHIESEQKTHNIWMRKYMIDIVAMDYYIVIHGIGTFSLREAILEHDLFNDEFSPISNHVHGERYHFQPHRKMYLLIDCYACRDDQRVEQIYEMINHPISVIWHTANGGGKAMVADMTHCDTVPSGYSNKDIVRMMFTIPNTW